MKGETGRLLKFSPFLLTFPLSQTEVWFHILGYLSLQIFSKKFIFVPNDLLPYFLYNLKLISKHRWLY